MNEVIDNIKKRRSIRSYKDEQIKEEELNAILEAGIYAPSGCNEQPWYFTVIQDKEFMVHINDKVKEGIKGCGIEFFEKMASNPNFNVYYNAPTLVIVSGKENAPTSLADCSAAIQNMLLAAESLNIGSVWLGLTSFCFDNPEEAKKLNIPEGYKPYFGVALGYKASDKQLTALPRKEGVVNYIR